MDIIVENQKGVTFTIEIGYFDKVIEIKEKIQKYKDNPVSDQTLVFNGKVLEDDGDVESCVLLHKSRLRLIVSASSPPLQDESNKKIKVDHDQFSPTPISKKTQLLLKLPTPKAQVFLDVDLGDSVELLKEKLHDMEGFPISRLALYVNGKIELQDHRCLREYELADGSEIDVIVKPPPNMSPPVMTNSMPVSVTKKIKVQVLPMCGTKRLVVEVHPAEKVEVLRTELEKMQQRMSFKLPPEGYFFIYKQNVMEEKESFQWHNVRQADVIEIFNGSVTGGP